MKHKVTLILNKLKWVLVFLLLLSGVASTLLYTFTAKMYSSFLSCPEGIWEIIVSKNFYWYISPEFKWFGWALVGIIIVLCLKDYINGKKLWCGDVGIDIDHVGDGMPHNPLDYKKAASKMVVALAKKEKRKDKPFQMWPKGY